MNIASLIKSFDSNVDKTTLTSSLYWIPTEYVPDLAYDFYEGCWDDYGYFGKHSSVFIAMYNPMKLTEEYDNAALKSYRKKVGV